MDIYSLKENLVVLEEIGHTLDAPERYILLDFRMSLEMGLLKLTDLANSDQLLFWGKILTTGNPYYIAVGIDFKDQYSFPHKKFFYSGPNFEFQEFPGLDVFNKDQVDNFVSLPFTGDPAHILINVQGEEGQEPQPEAEENAEESSEEEQVKILPKNYTELDRLAYTVRAIEIECQIVPIGAFRMCEKHELRYNENFKGLPSSCRNSSQEENLSRFQHFRYPLNPKYVERLESAETVFSLELLEPIENSSEWSAQQNITGDFLTIRNLVWAGYISYCYVGAKKFGSIYYGTGIKNVDLRFYV